MAGRPRSDVDLLRLAELLQEHITPALCHAAFGRVRKTERQRVGTLTALVLLGGRHSAALRALSQAWGPVNLDATLPEDHLHAPSGPWWTSSTSPPCTPRL